VVIDTVNDVVIGDIDDKIVNTGGVAVRPFWWGNEYLEELGLKTYLLDTGLSGKEDGESTGSIDSTLGSSDGNALESGIQAASSGAAGLIAAILLTAAAAIAATTYFISRKRKLNNPIQYAPPQHYQSGDSSTFPSYCANCGKPLTPGSNFCPGCGEKILEH
jgi:hypothetical protein